MRRKLIAILTFVVFLIIITTETLPLNIADELNIYYIKNYIQDTGAYNCVTSIYLNYRVFDTLFETLLLLISVIGIIYFSRHEGDY